MAKAPVIFAPKTPAPAPAPAPFVPYLPPPKRVAPTPITQAPPTPAPSAPPPIFAPRSPAPAPAPVAAPAPPAGPVIFAPKTPAPAPAPVAFGPQPSAPPASSAPPLPITQQGPSGGKIPPFTLPTAQSIVSGPDAIIRSYAQHVAPYAAQGGGFHILATDFGGVNPEDYGQDDAMIQGIKSKAAVLVQSTDLFAQTQKIWQGAEAGLAVGAAIGISVSIAAAVLSSLGFAALSDILAALVGSIAAAISSALAAAGVTAFTTAVIAGGSFGYVGAIIGAVIGACIALGNILTGGQHVTIEDGRSFSCSDYVSRNMAGASDFLTKANLVGVTPLWLAQTFGLFIANPTWLYNNQDKFPGHGQPPPPDPGSGDPLDLVYSQLPGAFEMLNRAQLAAASALMMTTSQKNDFYQSIPTKGPISPDPVDTNYKALISMTELPWALGNPYQYGYINGQGSNDGFQYASCPHLWTNNSVVLGDLTAGGKVTKQTDVCPGIYAIQVLYPSLTKQQSEKLFTQATAQFDNLQLANAMAGDLSSFVQGGSVSQTDGAPLPTNTHPGVSAPAAPVQLGAVGVSIGPGSLAGFSLPSGSGFMGGWSPQPLTPSEIALGNASLAAGRAAAANLLANPPDWSKVIASIQPLTPAQAVAVLGTSAAAKVATMVPTPAMTAAAATTIAHTVAAANAGHPVAVANAKLLDMAQRLSVQAQWASHYFGPGVTAGILAANPSALQPGTGKYDRNLPLILEQTVSAALADPNRTKAGLQQLASAFYQVA